MKRCVIHVDDAVHPLTVSEHGSEATMPVDCPRCGAAAPVGVGGKSFGIGGRDYYHADGHCLVCGERIGELRAYVDTIFGLEEDHAVQVHGRARVY